ncbi:MAG: phosphatase PAP2 family protein [Schleiferiaceae bacterium]|nr:phosphatase PAP2 family protein [Schleiferiaceae bacterium]
MLRSIFPCVLGVFTWAATAQPVYLLSAKKEAAIALGVGSMAVGNLWLGQQLQGFSEAELAALDASSVPTLDRWSLNRWDESAGHRSDILFYAAAAWSSATVLMPAWEEKNIWASLPAAFMWVEMNSLTLMATDLTKNLVSRPRPYAYFSEAPMMERVAPDARKSFFSGHTSMTAANSFYAAKMYSDRFPDSRWKPWVWTAAAVLPAITAQQRMAAGKHFFSDVLVGYMVGACVGYIVPEIHRRR